MAQRCAGLAEAETAQLAGQGSAEEEVWIYPIGSQNASNASQMPVERTLSQSTTRRQPPATHPPLTHAPAPAPSPCTLPAVRCGQPYYGHYIPRGERQHRQVGRGVSPMTAAQHGMQAGASGYDTIGRSQGRNGVDGRRGRVLRKWWPQSSSLVTVARENTPSATFLPHCCAAASQWSRPRSCPPLPASFERPSTVVLFSSQLPPFPS